jgi:hypothetical protein
VTLGTLLDVRRERPVRLELVLAERNESVSDFGS